MPFGATSSVEALGSVGSGVTNTTAPGTGRDWNPLTCPPIDANGVSAIVPAFTCAPSGICTWSSPASCSSAVTRML